MTKSIIFLTILGSPALSWSDELSNQVGGGTYQLNVSDNHEMSGKFVSYTRYFSSVVGLKTSYFKADHKSIPGADSSGFDINLTATSSHKSGFNLFLGLGYFSETWNVPATAASNPFNKIQTRAWRSAANKTSLIGENKYSGIQVFLGAGFSYKHFAVSYLFTVRNKATYEDNFGSNLPGLELIPIAQNIEIALRF